MEAPCLSGNHTPPKVTTTSEVGPRDLDRPITMPIIPLLLVNIITTNKNIITMTTNAPHMGAPEAPLDIEVAHLIGPLPKDLIGTQWIPGTKNFQVGPWERHIPGMISIATFMREMKAKNPTPTGPILHPPGAICQHHIREVDLRGWLL